MVSVKICGLTNYEDAAFAIDCGASYIGFIFAESKRRVTPAQFVNILDSLRKNGYLNSCKSVGVFVNESVDAMDEIAASCGLDLIQLHGEENSIQMSKLKTQWYKAFRVNTDSDIDIMQNWSCGRFLVDAKVDGVYGGSGVSVPFHLAKKACQKTLQLNREFFLAGGITPANVMEMIDIVQPTGIDVSSGVESSPGIKDHEKIKQLFKAVH